MTDAAESASAQTPSERLRFKFILYPLSCVAGRSRLRRSRDAPLARTARTVTQLTLRVTIECVTIFAVLLELMHLRNANVPCAIRAPFACSKQRHRDRSLRATVFFRSRESCGLDALFCVTHCTPKIISKGNMKRLSSLA